MKTKTLIRDKSGVFWMRPASWLSNPETLENLKQTGGRLATPAEVASFKELNPDLKFEIIVEVKPKTKPKKEKIDIPKEEE